MVDDELTDYLNEIGQFDLLTRPEELALIDRLRQGDTAAGTALIERNLRLVVKIAKSYTSYGIPFRDLIQEGNVGLTEAVLSFAVARDTQFVYYAATCIHHQILNVIRKISPLQTISLEDSGDFVDPATASDNTPKLNDALLTLTPSERRAVGLYAEGYRPGESGKEYAIALRKLSHPARVRLIV